MGTVRRIRQRAEAPTLSEAIAAYLATLDHPETAGTRRVYASTLRQLARHLGAEVPVAALDEPDTAKRLAGWFADRWGTRAPATFNRNLDAIRSAIGYWRDQDWITDRPDPPAAPPRPRTRPHQGAVPRRNPGPARPRGPRPARARAVAAAV